MVSLVQALALALVWGPSQVRVLELAFYPSNRRTCFYLHIFFFDPITILLENLGQLGICALEENHQHIETTEKTEGWFTRSDHLPESAVSRE